MAASNTFEKVETSLGVYLLTPAEAQTLHRLFGYTSDRQQVANNSIKSDFAQFLTQNISAAKRPGLAIESLQESKTPQRFSPVVTDAISRLSDRDASIKQVASDKFRPATVKSSIDDFTEPKPLPTKSSRKTPPARHKRGPLILRVAHPKFMFAYEEKVRAEKWLCDYIINDGRTLKWENKIPKDSLRFEELMRRFSAEFLGDEYVKRGSKAVFARVRDLTGSIIE